MNANMAEVRTVRPRADWQSAREVTDDSGATTLVQVRHALGAHLRDTYPVGAMDLEVAVDEGSAEGLATVVGALFAEEPACRRIVSGIDPDDEQAAARAEAAGLRGIVEVDLPEGGTVVLWVTEPEKVATRSTAIDDLPQT